jgi:hypothetical protein
MVRTLASRFQRWFKQEQDAHAKVLRSLESVPTDRRSGTEFQKAVNILAHVAAARKIWLIRLGLIHGQGSLTPKEMTLPDVEQMLDLVHGHWSGYLERVTDEELGGVRVPEPGRRPVPQPSRGRPGATLRPLLVPPRPDRHAGQSRRGRARRHRPDLLVQAGRPWLTFRAEVKDVEATLILIDASWGEA